MYTTLTEDVKEFMGKGIFDRNWVTLLQVRYISPAVETPSDSNVRSRASISNRSLTIIVVSQMMLQANMEMPSSVLHSLNL